MRILSPAAIGVLMMQLMSATVLAQPPPAGYVKIVSGAAFIERGGSEQPAQPGDAIYPSDGLRTGANGRLGVTLKDDTRLSLGPNSGLSLTEFSFSPAEGRLGLVVRMARGVAAYVAGRIAKLKPDAVRIETPASIVGVRGTHVLIRAEAP